MEKVVNSYSERGAFNLKEAAGFIGTNVTTLATLVRNPDFPAFRVGRRWVIPRDSLVRWLTEQAEARSRL